jgi:A/G-specific adenine glycosylase
MPHDTLSRALLPWFDQYGRKHLPWQQQPDPYRVWVSEIMLQQTQVTTVIPYYEKFMARFPSVEALAAADLDTVLHLWTGLGYYARARNLHKTAGIVATTYNGKFPQSLEELSALPGIGRSTAGAIIALGMKQRAVILDGNVKRVLSRVYCIEGWPDQPKVQQTLWQLAEEATPTERCAAYTQAIMDLGATLCSRSKPACGLCPLNSICEAWLQNRTSEFPQRKPAKALPEKQTCMLIFHDRANNRVLLEQRPAQGIWGGLWSFPETENADSFDPGMHRDLLPDMRSARLWAPLRHTFTHFHLDITPVLIPLEQTHVGVGESARLLWYDLENPQEIGLAAPVKKLLNKLG